MGYVYNVVKVLWTTEDEIRFIAELVQEGKKSTVIKYLDAMKLRRKWERINREEVERYVKRIVEME